MLLTRGPGDTGHFYFGIFMYRKVIKIEKYFKVGDKVRYTDTDWEELKTGNIGTVLVIRADDRGYQELEIIVVGQQKPVRIFSKFCELATAPISEEQKEDNCSMWDSIAK